MTQKHSNNWDKLKAPARPSQSVIDVYKSLIPGGDIFLLGVTPEIANSYDNIMAVDYDIKMIENVWPGDTETKSATNSSWETFLTSKKFDGVIGDVALTLLADKKSITTFNQKAFGMLKPGGVIAQRIYHKSKETITRDMLIDMLSKPAAMNFTAFKWLMFSCYAEETHSKIQLKNILKLFNEICPVREFASKDTGWSIDDINTIDIYKETNWEIIVMSKKEWLETVPKGAVNVQFTYNDDYDLAELCPVLSYGKNL
jgi:hypothetical protein